MNLLSVLALIMLVLVGYSAGVTAVARWKAVPPAILDLLLVLVILAAAFVLRSALGHWLSVWVWLVAAGVIGGLVTAVRHAQTPRQVPLLPKYNNPFRHLWERWKLFAQDMGNYQGRLLMGFFYFIIVTPFGLGARLISDALHLRPPQTNSAWQEKEAMAHTLEESRQQG